MSQCIRCGVKKNHPRYGIIWTSEDGYCSVCNNKFKERKRTVNGMDNYVSTKIVKEGSYSHLDSQGRKLTNKRKLLNSIYKKERAINAAILYKKIKAREVRNLEEWI